MSEPALKFSIKSFGFPQVQSALRRIAFKATNLEIPFEAAGRYLVAQTHAHFREERSPEGVPWKSLSAAYVAAKKPGGRGGAAHPIRHITGASEASVTYRASPMRLIVGSDLRFPGSSKSAFAIHELGGRAGRDAYIPARPSLGVNETDEHRIGDFFIEYLMTLT